MLGIIPINVRNSQYLNTYLMYSQHYYSVFGCNCSFNALLADPYDSHAYFSRNPLAYNRVGATNWDRQKQWFTNTQCVLLEDYAIVFWVKKKFLGRTAVKPITFSISSYCCIFNLKLPNHNRNYFAKLLFHFGTAVITCTM